MQVCNYVIFVIARCERGRERERLCQCMCAVDEFKNPQYVYLFFFFFFKFDGWLANNDMVLFLLFCRNIAIRDILPGILNKANVRYILHWMWYMLKIVFWSIISPFVSSSKSKISIYSVKLLLFSGLKDELQIIIWKQCDKFQIE